MDPENKRILIFNVNWLGDVLFSTAVIRNIRYNFPDSYIGVVVPGYCAEILRDNPYLDEVIIFDEKKTHKGFLAQLNFVKRLRIKQFDTVFLLHRSFSRGLICRLAGIPERIGHDTKKRGFLLTQRINAPDPYSLHRIDYYLSVIEGAGLKIKDRHTDFYFNQTDAKYVDVFLRNHGIQEGDYLVGVNPAGNWLPKRWPPQEWAKLSDQLIAKRKAIVIITGSSADMLLAHKIQSLMQQEPLIACGAFTLKQLAVLITRMDIFISADSGPLHIANAVGAKRIIALFGPTDANVTGPYPLRNVIVLQKNVGCKIPCYTVKCKDNRCMKAITPEEVMDTIAQRG